MRLIAWSEELRRVHQRLRSALQVTRDALDTGADTATSTRELLLFCHGFCTVLTSHHRGEDRELFPTIARQHPELSDTLRKLLQDHSMIGHLVSGLQHAVDERAEPATLERHLEGISAIMESHFRYEERQLLTVLESLHLDADPTSVFGPL